MKLSNNIRIITFQDSPNLLLKFSKTICIGYKNGYKNGELKLMDRNQYTLPL
jgi:hypothetical protein